MRNEGEGGGIVSPGATSSSRDPIRRRWFSEDSVSEGQSRQFGERSRPMSDVTSLASEQMNILGGLQNTTVGSVEDDRGRYSRHMNDQKPTQPYRAPLQKQAKPQNVQQERQQAVPAASSSAVLPSSLSLELEAKPEVRNGGTDLQTNRMTFSESSPIESRDWTSTPRMPIGSQISNPRRKDHHQVPLSPSSSSVSNSFIWMPSTTSVNYRTRAPFATTSPRAQTRTSSSPSAASVAPAPDKLGNKRFQRTSLW